MQTATFHGEIQGGRILTPQPLTEFEGKQVIITLSVPESPPRTEDGDAYSDEPAASPFAPEAPVILEDLGRVRLPPRDVITLRGRIIDVGRLPPRVYPSDEED